MPSFAVSPAAQAAVAVTAPRGDRRDHRSDDRTNDRRGDYRSDHGADDGRGDDHAGDRVAMVDYTRAGRYC